MGWNKFFGFNKKERIGVIALTAFLIIIISGYLFLPRFFSSFEPQNTAQLKKEVEKFIADKKKKKKEDNQFKEQKKSVQNKQKKQPGIYATAKLNPFKFNPNNLPEDKWKAIGFSEKQISIIKNYEAHGGSFRKKEDLKRIYGISKEEYAQLEPYINITEEKSIAETEKGFEKPPEKKADSEREPLSIELNTADSSELRKVYGIGPVFSSRIVKFRNLLGGFYSPKQLIEVYGIDSSKYEQIKNHFYTDTSAITTININTATFKEMAAHPYLDQYLVKAILQYRQDNGPLKNLAELKNISLVYDDLYHRIEPYFILQ